MLGDVNGNVQILTEIEPKRPRVEEVRVFFETPQWDNEQ